MLSSTISEFHMKLLLGCTVCAVLLLVPAVLIAVLVYRAGRGNRARRRVMRVGEPTVAWVSMCTVNLNEGGPGDGWAIALISPNPKVKIGDLAGILKTINDSPIGEEDGDLAFAFLAVTPTGQPYQEGFRSRLPDSVTGGREVYVAHIWVFLSDVPGGKRFPNESDVALPCQVNWDENDSLMCSRPDGWTRPAEKPVPARPQSLDVRRPFTVRFLTVRPVPSVREIEVRVGCAVHPDAQEQPWVVVEATRNLQIAVQNLDHPHATLACKLFRADAGDPPARLPDEFSQGDEIWLFGARIAVDDLPADTRDQWAVPPDLYCSTVRLDKRTGRLTFTQKPADRVLGRQRQRVRVAERNGGEPVYAVLVQANMSLFHPGEDDQPSTVVYSPDPEVTVDRLRQIADLIAALKGLDQSDPDLAMLSEYVTNETACPYRRRRVAGHLADGRKVYIADLHVYRAFLPGGVLHGRDTLLCVAEPGSRGGALELMEENLRSEEMARKSAAEMVTKIRRDMMRQ